MEYRLVLWLYKKQIYAFIYVPTISPYCVHLLRPNFFSHLLQPNTLLVLTLHHTTLLSCANHSSGFLYHEHGLLECSEECKCRGRGIWWCLQVQVLLLLPCQTVLQHQCRYHTSTRHQLMEILNKIRTSIQKYQITKV